MYFVFLMLERSLGLAKAEGLPLLPRLAMRCWTLFVVALCWTVFRSSSLPDAIDYFSLLFGSSGMMFDAMAQSYLVNGGVLMAVAAICAFPIPNALKSLERKRWVAGVAPVVRFAFLVLTLVASVLMCFKSSHNPAIYFQF